MKRLFDFGIALFACIVLSPLLLVLGILIRLETAGSSIYRQERIGKDEQPFQLLKFRSMRSDMAGPEITLGTTDPRITGIGHWMRKTKLDELPRLWNIVKGDMSFVGPRPEVAQYVALYTPEQRQVLSVRPGLTDPASIEAFDEGARIASAEDPEAHYREVILPAKVNLQLAYIRKANVLSDGWVIVRTLLRILQRG